MVKASERKFVNEYLKDSNATQAAIRAGYSKRSAYELGSRLLKKVEVKAAIEKSLDKAAAEALVDRAFIIKGLRQNAIRSQQGEPVMEFNHETKQMEPTGEWQYDSAGSNRAFELLGKTLGMFTDKLEVSGNIDGAKILKERRAKLKHSDQAQS